MFQRRAMHCVDGGPVVGREGNHLTVAGLMRLAVIGFADHEEGPRAPGAVPPGPWLLALAEPKLDAEAVHDGAVEVQGALEIGHAHEDM
jgi:hypothetical protein